MITILKVQSARYLKNGWIDARLVVNDNGTVIEDWPYTATPDDLSQFCRDTFDLLKSERLGPVSKYTDEDATRDATLERNERKSALMLEADRIIRPLSDERDAEIISDNDLKRWKVWVKYRKALRELDISNLEIDWPQKPE